VNRTLLGGSVFNPRVRIQMLIENTKSRAVLNGRHNQEETGRSNDVVNVWRVPGNNGTSFRFCCRLGRLMVYEEPRERHVLTVNIGRLAEVRRRALVAMEKQKASLPVIRELTRGEEVACWGKAAVDPETRFFETLKGGPEKLGGRWKTMSLLAALLESCGKSAPWPDSPHLG
jgi:hypothetical protein